jgi:hypothetical protein
MAIGDQVGKQAADEVVAQLPALEVFVDAQLTKIQNTVKQIVSDAKAELETVVGGSLAAITAERTEAVKQITDEAHSILDRINLPQLINPRKNS